MEDLYSIRLPAAIVRIEAETLAMGFGMASDRRTGALLRTLAASRRAGRLLELGTGTGMATCWMLDGMDAEARLLTVDSDPAAVATAKRILGEDTRVAFHVDDGSAFLRGLAGRQFDLIFADTWPGKYYDLEETLALLAPGGLYVIDDMLPQPNWPEGHAAKAAALLEQLDQRADLVVTRLCWSTGLLLCAKR